MDVVDGAMRVNVMMGTAAVVAKNSIAGVEGRTGNRAVVISSLMWVWWPGRGGSPDEGCEDRWREAAGSFGCPSADPGAPRSSVCSGSKEREQE
jgi:hypothetical protein